MRSSFATLQQKLVSTLASNKPSSTATTVLGMSFRFSARSSLVLVFRSFFFFFFFFLLAWKKKKKHSNLHCNFFFFCYSNGADCRPGRARYSNDDHGMKKQNKNKNIRMFFFFKCFVKGGVPGSPGSRGGGDLGTEYTTSDKGNNQVVNSALIFEGDVAGVFHKTRFQDKV